MFLGLVFVCLFFVCFQMWLGPIDMSQDNVTKPRKLNNC